MPARVVQTIDCLELLRVWSAKLDAAYRKHRKALERYHRMLHELDPSHQAAPAVQEASRAVSASLREFVSMSKICEEIVLWGKFFPEDE